MYRAAIISFGLVLQGLAPVHGNMFSKMFLGDNPFSKMFLGDNPNLPPNPKENRKPFSMAMVQNNKLPFAAYHRAAIVAGASSDYIPNVHMFKDRELPNFELSCEDESVGWTGIESLFW